MTYSQSVADVKFWISGDSTKTIDYTAADINAHLNNYYDEIVSIIKQSDGKWEWDDNNQTDLPIATTSLVSGQGDYTVDAGDFLNIIRVEMKDSSGNWIVLQPMSYEDKQGIAINELDENQGTPDSYDKVGNSIVLHTIPNYSSSGGLKVYFQRVPVYFETTDTTETAGFNPLYHRYLSMGAALDYCMVNSMTDRVQLLMSKMEDMRARIKNDYAMRSKDEHLKMSVSNEDYGQDLNYGISENKVG